jgi:hypothetical protein
MERIGDRIYYYENGGKAIFRVHLNYFALVIYLVVLAFLWYLGFRLIFFTLAILSFLSYIGYEEFIIDVSKEKIIKRLGIFGLYLPSSTEFSGFSELVMKLSMKFSVGGEAPVKDVFSIEITSKGKKEEFYSTSDKKFVELLKERLNKVYPFNWNENLD